MRLVTGKDQYRGKAAHSGTDKTLGNLQESFFSLFITNDPQTSQCLPQQ